MLYRTDINCKDLLLKQFAVVKFYEFVGMEYRIWMDCVENPIIIYVIRGRNIFVSSTFSFFLLQNTYVRYIIFVFKSGFGLDNLKFIYKLF